MSLHDYQHAGELVAKDPPFRALLMAAMRRADPHNQQLLAQTWPGVWYELQARDSTPNGALQHEAAREVVMP